MHIQIDTMETRHHTGAVVGMTAGEIDEVVKCLKRYADTTEENYCCADCIEDIAKAVGFSFERTKTKEAGK